MTKKLNENFYIKLMHLLKILAFLLFKYYHLNLGNLVVEKKLNDKSWKVNFFFRKIFCGTLNEADSANALFRFSQKDFLKRKFTISKIPIQIRAQHERNAYNKEKERVTIIFHSKTKLTQNRFVIIILKYLIDENFVG